MQTLPCAGQWPFPAGWNSLKQSVSPFCTTIWILEPILIEKDIMKILVNTDNHIHGTHDLSDRVESMIEKAIGHHASHITRVEAHLGDVNSEKGGADDKRCMLEARLENHQPVSAHHTADTLAAAIDGAGRKLGRVIESTLGKLAAR